MTVAITREVSPRFSDCELTHIERQSIDMRLARRQHADYVRALESCGCTIIELPAEPELPDSVFVEDTAVVFPELALITRPGAESRRAETAPVAAILAEYRRLAYIVEPGTLDGGDVLVMDREVFVGRSSRSNAEGIQQLRAAIEGRGYTVRELTPKGCLHLKSAVTRLGLNTVLVNPAWVDTAAFVGYEVVLVDPLEPFAANCLALAPAVVYPLGFPRTQRRLQSHGRLIMSVDVSELAKAEGAVTCCSLIVAE